MKTRNGAIVALLLLATCDQVTPLPDPSGVESSERALGQVPATESAIWQKVGSSTLPDRRYLQAVAFDDARRVAVMFGGTDMSLNTGMATPNQETWEWNTTTGKWTNRTGTGAAPAARSGAAMVYDSKRAKFILFGGRAGSGYNYEDTWEWDPATGGWTEVTNAGARPSARSQHGMVYEVSTDKILLFGGGRSDSNSPDASGISMSLGDTWELDPATYAWTALTTPTAPRPRHDCGFVWDGARNKAVLFGGLQVDMTGVSGVPKQDTWEWDPGAATWTERTSAGTKPGPRYGHSMAFDGSRGKVVVFGGFDIATGGNLSDLWDWDPTTGAWAQRMSGSETPMPSARRYASLVSDDARARLELIAGAANYDPYGKGGTGGIIIYPPGYPYATAGTRDVWELDPAKPAFTDRTAPSDIPPARTGHVMAYNPSTGRTYLFGGVDQMTGQMYNDLWAWDGTTWSEVASDNKPSPRTDTALAYDPARKSLILFGGSTVNGATNDTWEWSHSRGWTQLSPSQSPDALFGHGMVTDTNRNKILVFGGIRYPYYWGPIFMDPTSNEVWEWDGATVIWTNRTPPASSSVPSPRQYPVMAYDSGQKKLFLYDGNTYSFSMGAYWEWDPVTAGWATRDTKDNSKYGYATLGSYDSIRRREVLLVQTNDPMTGNPSGETWELDANSQTLYVRSIVSPATVYGAAMAFDQERGVMVLFGGVPMNSSDATDETWEYRVTGLGNGEGCTPDFASSCASGFCVEGVCCEASSCSGPCRSCNVKGREGTCGPAQAGTEIPGSCSNGKACDGNGNCMSSNGQPCTSGSTCASGFCVDGVCCNNGCTGTCMACNQTGLAGKCTPFASGTDPQNECGKGTDVCKSACDGVSSCAYPSTNVTCGNCMTCDGFGKCSIYDPYCGGFGGYPYPTGGTGGRPIPTGGTGGYVTGGSGGYAGRGGSGGMGYGGSGGSGGRTYPAGGAGGGTTPRGGSGGTGYGGVGGTTARGGSGGFGASGGGTGRGGSGGFGGGSGGRTGGAAGTTAGSGGGAGSTVVGTGGTAGQGGSSVGGTGGKADGGSPKGGSGGKRDGGLGPDATADIRLHNTGCACALGRAPSTDSHLTLPFLAIAVGLLAARRRRRRG